MRKRGAWGTIGYALDRAHNQQQLAFCSFRAHETRPFAAVPGQSRLAYLAFVDEALNSHFQHPSPDFPWTAETYYMRLCDLLGQLNFLDDYLDGLDAETDGWRSQGFAGMKTAAAYMSGLSIPNPTEATARAALGRKNDMSRADLTVVRDYAFHHPLRACMRNGLPMVIHTGFQIWRHASLAQANPMLLHNIPVAPRYSDLTFVLLHGGNPYIGETA